MSDLLGFFDVLEYGARKNDVEAVGWIGEWTASLDYYGMVQKRVGEHRFVDITPFNVRTPTPQVKQAATVFDHVVKDVLAPSGTEIENPISGAKNSVDLGVQCDTGVCMAEATDIAFREEAPLQCQAIHELPRNSRVSLQTDVVARGAHH
jgi:hypothetical protein